MQMRENKIFEHQAIYILNKVKVEQWIVGNLSEGETFNLNSSITRGEYKILNYQTESLKYESGILINILLLFFT
ncbi:hypothetical protein CQP30_05545 [Yersinia pestis]|nr:hypothetical protein A1122_17140 [Yersinia pestis A1122]ANW13844.1 hypothetical protein BAY22_07585 [Yersinia pestis]AYW88401.1 hypothetical protein EGX87_15130 [Yersinia pseudotuberculosis]EKS46140.1 hypothetical protein INS_09077 [Yersinia pestis INS]ERP74157.1 hypothetical protein L327_08665 [Yersinia pestis S3]ERP74871.1 hypothetical protein L328_08610 [Yersinia pestis 24H]ERP75357.1 hypothetical protein L326_08595 [Yersinia pestis 113]ERP83105.1 hypothetical protein L325_08620 [Yersi